MTSYVVTLVVLLAPLLLAAAAIVAVVAIICFVLQIACSVFLLFVQLLSSIQIANSYKWALLLTIGLVALGFIISNSYNLLVVSTPVAMSAAISFLTPVRGLQKKSDALSY